MIGLARARLRALASERDSDSEIDTPEHPCDGAPRLVTRPAAAFPPSPRVNRRAPAGRGAATVLVLDIKDSMTLCASIDAEEWWSLMADFFQSLCTVVQRHGGWVERFTGDGICATFGAMQACDEHAERACHAALALRTQTEIASAALRSRRDVGLTVRIGINTGEVAFGIIGEGPTSQFATLGHDVGLAQRMESLATPGSILLTERVAARVRSGFVLRPLGGVTVKGSTDRLRAFELVTARSRTVSAVASRVRVAPAT